MVNVDGSSVQADSQLKLVGLVSESVGAWRWVCIHQKNWVNSSNGYGHDDSTINTDIGIIIIIIIFWAHQHKAAGLKIKLLLLLLLLFFALRCISPEG